MQNCLSISKSDLLYNAEAVAAYVQTPIIAVVKMNGYGVGTENAVRAWYEAGVLFFAAAEPQEALDIAALGLEDADILLMSPCSDEQTIAELAQNNIIFTVTGTAGARRIANVCLPLGITARAHIKIDTGMGRFGERYDNIEAVKDIYCCDGIDFCGIFSHFALSFENTYSATKTQLDRFTGLIDELRAAGIDVGTAHIANTCAAVLYPETRLDAVRVGSALVGRPMRSIPLELRPVGVLKARVADLKELKCGDTSGYAMIFKAKRDMKCAVIEAGFAHGFGMQRKSDCFRFVDVLRDIYHSIKGFRHPLFVIDAAGEKHCVVGRVGNQFTLVDNSDGRLKIGDFVRINVNILMVDSAVLRVLE